MIEVKNLTKAYGNFVAVKDVSFKAESGSILGFLGPNGAGKTTTMRIITGYMPATAGTVLIDGLDIFSQSLEARRKIGYLPENPPLYPDMRVEAYLRFVAKLRDVPRAKIESALEHVLEVCGLTDMAHRICGQLSKGYRQRVGLAQALIHDPPVLVLDEPTIGLDPRQIHEIRGLIHHLAGNRTVVLSTHILPEVSQICDKVVIIADGRVVLEEYLKTAAGRDLARRHLPERDHQRASRGRRDGRRKAGGGWSGAYLDARAARMKNSLTIAGKELAGYFLQPVAYVVMTVFLLLGGFFFFALLRYFEVTLTAYAAMQNPEVLQKLNLNERVIEPMLHNLAIVLVILVPAITMRSFAEEKRTGTYELLLTAPIRTGEIVAGKFIAAAAFMLIMIGLAGMFPLILIAFGNPGNRRDVLRLPGSRVPGDLVRFDRAVHQLADAESDNRGDQLFRPAAGAVRDFVAGAGGRIVSSPTCCAIFRCRIISRRWLPVSSTRATSSIS